MDIIAILITVFSGIGFWAWILSCIHSNRLSNVRPGRHQHEDMIYEAVNTLFYLIIGTTMVMIAFFMATNTI